MPLVELVTDFKSLKYGKDTPGGGWSGQPYIQSKIPDGLSPKSPDFLLRNGYLSPLDSIEDVKRLTKMFGDLKSPNGLFFIAKQNVLSNSAVRTQTSGVQNEFIYTPLSTLAQAGVVANGFHLNKQGIDPFKETGAYAQGDWLYNSVVKSSQPLAENRLVQLQRSIKENISVTLNGLELNNGIEGVNILSYKGGPGAPLGIGNTNIRFADQRTGDNNPLKVSNPRYFSGKDGVKSIDFENKQVGGLRIDSTKSWIKPNLDLVTLTTTYKLANRLPDFNINSPQSGSLTKNIWYSGSATWIPQHEGASLNKINIETLLSKGGSSQIYSDLVKKAGYNNWEINNNFANTQLSVYSQGNTFPEVNTPVVQANNTFTYNQKDLIEQPTNWGTLNGSPKIQDFRAVLRANLGENSYEGKKATNLGATPISPNYNTKNIEKRVNIGGAEGMGPGARSGRSYASYTTGVQTLDGSGNPNGVVGAQDLINALPIYRSAAVDTTQPVNDLVKFRIAAIDGNNPNFKTFMHFRAFIDSFSDSYTADWGNVRYLGRGEKFYNYNGFDRSISLSFTVAALSKPELIPMYKKLNYLASNLTPDYSPFGYMRGPLVQLTVGGYLHEQVGFISSLTYDIPNDTTWEIGINDTAGDPPSNVTTGLKNLKKLSDSSVKELPHRITVSSFQFTPIHDFRPGKQGLGFNGKDVGSGDNGFVTRYGKQRYIALEAVTNNYDDTPDNPPYPID